MSGARSLLRFDGRVAIVTGAGRGIGRDYALLLASRGAKVVVNDLGVDLTGLGKNSKPVDEVVQTIKSFGGIAVPNYDSVEDGEKVIKTAIDNFGRIDILVNNAGIIRDKSFSRISDLDWDLVHKVHLRGSFMCTRAAWPYMKQQKYGRIIMTSSTSGLYGNFGQSNYSAAKLGLVGFMNTLALEGQKYNVFCNTIVPAALSRLTQGLIPEEVGEIFKPEYIAPVVCYMCHENCTENGVVIESAGGWAAKVRLQKSGGVAMRKAENTFSIEDVQSNWDAITDMTCNPLYHTSASEATAHTVKLILEKLNDSSKPIPTSFESAIGYQFTAPPFNYTERDVILYALGVGATVSENDTSQLKFLYEGHEEFSVIPSYAVIPAQSAMTGVMTGLPAFSQVNLARMLHGEQYIEIKKPFPTSGTLSHKGVISDILDKKSGAVVLFDVQSFDETGDLVAFNQFSIFMVGAGGFGGKRDSPHIKKSLSAPSRNPDASLREKTTSSQAALYRLNGDYNPLHIDKDFAAMGGFSTPILHGLCSFGFAVRHILRQYCNNDTTMVKAIKVRFSKPFLPGQTLQTDMWQENERIFFSCKCVESGDTVLTGGYVDLLTAPSLSSQDSSSDKESLKSTALFEQLKSVIATGGPEFVNRIRAVYLWNITKDGNLASQWTVDLKNPPGAVYQGEPKATRAGCTLTISDDDFIRLANGDLNPQQAFFGGKIKITGNVMLSQKLAQLFNQQSKL
ncbi:PREDICTED: peroxisomal multifunctional enzyme type 2 [Amphimedon queenslandica]|uniref:Peroxisomal multifunctional enzyme type 2 n=1 Tax=Amphimedon queenslandica TaxID=400682 RepID=A0A1X7VXP1_AMPQE|nr:PREDICTED: peroxisomal multifunctional enzyme type 2 [Amphimedon queenslandica]|eukprot:XP_003382406.1 PREDICTED: peroxisomal multifunctional enzyme type 2 [Amphimedon queenslandica]